MEIGLDSFVSTSLPQTSWGRAGDPDRMATLLEEIRLADEVGLDVFAIGEHHRPEFLASAPAILLAAAAAQTRRIKLASAVNVLSTDDPIRLFQQYATIDLISNGRAEITVGRGSFIESYPLFGHDLRDYDVLFTEKLDLLLKARAAATVDWSGRHRAPLTGEGVFPRPVQSLLPVRIGVGGTPESFARAGALGLPLVVAIIGGDPARFRPLIDLYRQSGRKAGHAPESLWVGIHSFGFVADSDKAAADGLYPAYEDAFARVGRERGWPPTSRHQFDMECGPTGALLLGAPATVAAKMRRVNDVLGGIDRITMLINGGELIGRDRTLRAIELLGREVAPLVRGAPD